MHHAATAYAVLLLVLSLAGCEPSRLLGPSDGGSPDRARPVKDRAAQVLDKKGPPADRAPAQDKVPWPGDKALWPDKSAPPPDKSAPPPDKGTPAKCPVGMADLGSFCMDLYEAPNTPGQVPLVMYSFYEADAWCQARGKRLCFDDEWTLACATPAGWSYPYGNTHKAGVCNDDKPWKTYDQSKLNGWPSTASTPSVTTVAGLLAAASAASSAGATAASHVQWLYQGTAAGAKTGCTNSSGVFDLQGNVEEWTRRRDGGSGAQFLGNLKGRYWAEPRTCQSGVKTHGNAFRFYEIGFRCCKDAPGPTG